MHNPKIMVIACSDSRVDPTLLFNTRPGDIFVVRNVANIVPPYEDDRSFSHGTSAALEFAISYLKVHHIIILGHSRCGGIKALLENTFAEPTSFIAKWMSWMEPVKKWVLQHHAEASNEEKLQILEKKAIQQSLKNLITFPFVLEKLMKKELFIHGWYFELHSGNLFTLNDSSNDFELVKY